jgi:RNA polymerase sigma-70 factor, ECF subfamily
VNDSADPYRKWLGIRTMQRPPDHYQLLGLERFADDAEAISHSARQRMTQVRRLANGEVPETRQRVLNELMTAKNCLLNRKAKSEYDAQLRAKSGRVASPPVTTSVAAEKLERYRDYLRFLADGQLERRWLGKVDLSEVVQLTLFEAHRAKPDLLNQPSDQRLAYLRQVLSNNLNDEIRKFSTGKRDVRREQSLEAAIEQSSINLVALVADDGSLPGARIERQERAVELAAALQRLPETQRKALVLQHWDGRSLAEIADEMGRTRAAVAGLLKRGLQQLRVEMRGLQE